MPANAAPKNTKALQISPVELQRRVDVIRDDGEFRERVGQALTLRFADKEPSPYVEKHIYDGFPGQKDQMLMEQFHEADWSKRAAIAEQIEDPRLREFAHRLVYFENPDLLPAAKSAELKAWIADRVLTDDESVPWMTVPKAMRETDSMLAEATGDDAILLSQVKNFLYQLADRFGAN
jgi:exodeoxyribonuclease-1